MCKKSHLKGIEFGLDRIKMKSLNGPKKATSTQRSSTASTAFSRWKILSGALYGQLPNNNSKNEASIRRFSSFGLFDVKEVGDQENTTSQQADQIHSSQQIQKESECKEVECNQPDNETSEACCTTYGNEHDKWYYYSLNYKETNFQIKLKFASNKIPIKELFKGFDFSGSYFWPSEEILSYFCFKNSFLFDNLNVCELGCGMAGLAGVTVGVRSKAKFVLLTDGNERCMENVQNIVKENRKLFDQTAVRCKQLKWKLMSEQSDAAQANPISTAELGKDSDQSECEAAASLDQQQNQQNLDDQTIERDDNLANKFEIVLCSDCLYFEKSHLPLIETIYSLLNENGTAIIVSPLRQNSFKDFMKLSSKYFHLKIHIVYDDIVWQLNRKFQRELAEIYSTDRHYPLMAILTKRSTILKWFGDLYLSGCRVLYLTGWHFMRFAPVVNPVHEMLT